MKTRQDNVFFCGSCFVGFVTAVVVLFNSYCGLAVATETNEREFRAVEPRCETLVNPLGVDAARPCLSWRLDSEGIGEFQSAYRILVATSKETLEQNRGDLWDSGVVSGRESLGIEYRGKALASGQRCFWKVQVWNAAGRTSAWSEIAFWETGLLRESDWRGVWINDGKKNPENDADFYKDDPAPLFRHEFTWNKKVASARLYIAGLGYFEARLNGRPVGDHVLDPAWTKPIKRVFYSTFDVTGLLAAQGKKNCLGVTLGNGWYNPLPMKMWGRFDLRKALDVGRPRFIAQLDVVFDDGSKASVCSSPEWKVSEGPMRRNSIYLGELYDARCEKTGWDMPGFDDAAWKKATKATEPVGKLVALAMPPIRVRDTFHAVSVKEPKPGVFVYDMGENFGGWAALTLNVPSGTKIVLRYGELLYRDGTLNPMTSVCGQIKRTVKTASGASESIAGPGAPAIAWQTDTYIARGAKNETYCPRFTFRGFRYLEVVGPEKAPPLESVRGMRLCTDVESRGEFACSNEDFNRVQTICRRTFLANVFSVQSDCPHRERFGYGGDIVATNEAFMMNFDMASFYSKAVRDWSDAALDDGMLTDTAPFVGIQYCGLVWAMAHPELVWQLRRYYGENRLVGEQYETARRWLALVGKKYPGHIVNEGLSDHESLCRQKPETLVTPMYYRSARLLERLARCLDRTDEAREYAMLADAIAAKWCAAMVDSKSGNVGDGTQTAQALALYIDDVCPGLLTNGLRERILARLLNMIETRDGERLTTGILGTKTLLDQLSREGRTDVAYRIADRPDFPGWRWMLKNGATTLWEHWEQNDNTFSHNHPMFGSISQWFYQRLGGIAPAEDANGFDRFRIAPQMVKELDWVKTSYKSVRGEIVSNWHRDAKKNTTTFDMVVPPNTTARVVLPVAEKDTVTANIVDKNGMRREMSPAESSKTFASEWSGSGRAYSLGSGRYSFTVICNGSGR